jgi:hypothetical protein
MHSWIVDLIIKYAVGLEVKDEKVMVDPFPFGLTEFGLDNVLVKGHSLAITYKRDDGLRLSVDGKTAAESKVLKSIEIPLRK